MLRNRWLGLHLGLAFMACALATPVHAARTKSKDKSEEPKPDKATVLYEKGVQLAEAGEFEKALEQFEKSDRERPNDAETLNMMAFANRKLGRLETAFELYDRALAVRADFPQAREYLGEAHIQAALEQVRILRGYGPSGAEELAQLLAAFEEAAFRLGIAGESRSGAAQRKW